MKGVGLALIVLALCAASFLEDAGLVDMAPNDAKGWDWLAFFGLAYAAWWFAASDDS